MNIQIYAINLDRSVDRWNALSRRAEEFQLPIVRVSGVDGTQTPPQQRVDCDIAAFEFKNGRTMLPGEYGCYRSHLKALTQFLASGDDLAVIVEDDIVLPADLLDRVRAAVAAVPDADVIKFFNHRVVAFRRIATSSLGDEIGRAAHGPLGSSACYAVSRSGAQRLLEGMQVMEFPLDMALERGWASGASIYITRLNVAEPTREPSTIASRTIYQANKFPWWKRLGTLATRTAEAVRRTAYALKG